MARRRGVAAPSFRLGTEAAEVLNYRETVADMFYNEAMAIACNSVTIDDHPAHIPERFVKRALLERGEMAYFGTFTNPETVNAFVCGGSRGVDIYGDPLAYVLAPMSGQAFTVDANSEMLAVIRANAMRYPVADAIRFAAERLADCEVAISANLVHCNSTDFIPVKDEKQVMTLKTAMRNKQLGLPTVYVRDEEQTALTRGQSAFSMSGDFFADRIAMLRDQYRNELLAKIGTLTANRYKKERVQSSEVNAGVGEVIDFVYMLIDQYNHDAELNGLPYRMRLNSAIADLYTEGEENANV